MTEPTSITGLRDIIDRYELFIVDQWGVLHNGVIPLPGSIEAMQKMRQSGAAIALMSNSGKRVSVSYDRLDKLGFDRSLYDFCLTSGEQVHQGLLHREDPFYAALGPRYFMFSWDEDRGITEGTGFEETDDLNEADFILCAGTDRPSIEDYEPILTQAMQRDLPMTCANPDKVSVQPDGSLRLCPGAIAARYEAMGGTVRWHGKPQLNAYDHIRRETGVAGPAIGIGDSLSHDIAGAAAAGMDGWFITGGIHKDDLPKPATDQSVADLGTRHGAVPRYYSAGFTW